MQIKPLSIAGALIITPQRFKDDRGWFEETWSAPKLAALGFHEHFVQDNLSFSRAPNTLRGLHCQLPPKAQGKLVSVISGEIWDIIVDIREGSPTFGKHERVELTEQSAHQLWVPPGCLHGFITQAPNTHVSYKVTEAYSHQHDRSIAWNDPSFDLDWGVKDPILSDKDASAPLLKNSDVRFQYQGEP